MVCGSSLEYLDEACELTCAACGKADSGHIRCPKGHYLCEECHTRDSRQVIEGIALDTQSKDPCEIAELMMSHPGLPMLGCDHAYIAAGALMAALRNEGSKKITAESIREVFLRTGKQAHGGYCGLTGVCGITPGIGACFAVLTGSRCGKDEEQQITMEAVTRVSRAIARLTGPSCCKAYVRAALETAADYLEERFGIRLPRSKGAGCAHSHRHPHGCREAKCPYFPAAAGGSFPSGGDGSRELRDGDDADRYLLGRGLELGADKAKIICTDAIAVEEWVRWKCLYGCALYEKDACHPPVAPDAESTRKALKGYRRAILLKGSKGIALTDIAVRLEGEAYHRGYYKAFALTSLSSGGGTA